MRGKAEQAALGALEGRITPAYAGKSISVPEKPVAVGDHPRVCGEKSLAEFSYRANQGSPPRMRGKVKNIRAWRCEEGITPAYAGKRD